MSPPTRLLLTLLLLAATVDLVARAVTPPPALGPPRAPFACSHAVEEAGRGVLCRARETPPLHDGDRRREDGSIDRMAAERRLLLDVGLDLNVASVAELAALSGVGPRLAERIVAGRPYRTVDEIARVRGIGPRLAHRIAPSLRVTAPATSDDPAEGAGRR